MGVEDTLLGNLKSLFADVVVVSLKQVGDIVLILEAIAKANRRLEVLIEFVLLVDRKLSKVSEQSPYIGQVASLLLVLADRSDQLRSFT